MYSIILVEDDSTQREILKTMILSRYESIKIYEADSESTALDIIEKNDINMFLIDISLNESSGLDLAIKIRKIPKYEFSQLVFLTTHIDYMLQAFKQVHCYDYILKPYNKDDVQAMINKLIVNDIKNSNDKNDDLKEENDKEILIKIRNSIFVRVNINDIVFIEVKGRDCEINTFSDTYKYINISLKKVLEIIDCEYIVQSHKGFAVNKNYILKIEKIDARLSSVHFKNYSKSVLLGHKFKNSIITEFIKVDQYYVK